MFNRKYVFETGPTKKRRRLLSIIGGLALFLALFGFCGLVILIAANRENKRSLESLYNRPPDLIVVYTGHHGRIPYALDLAKKLDQSKILVSGVYQKNSVETLLRPLGNEAEGTIDIDFIDLDYQAENTVENVISTLRYLHQNTGLSRVLIISHDYHILRIKMIMETLREDQENYRFFYMGKEANYKSFRNLKILTKEILKFFRTAGFLLLWEDNESV